MDNQKAYDFLMSFLAASKKLKAFWASTQAPSYVVQDE